MINGRDDTYFTIDEFAAMVDRAPKTIENWAAECRIRFVRLCGVPLVSLRMIENLIAGVVPARAPNAMTALRMMNRADARGRRASPEKRAAKHPRSDASGITSDQKGPFGVARTKRPRPI